MVGLVDVHRGYDLGFDPSPYERGQLWSLPGVSF